MSKMPKIHTSCLNKIKEPIDPRKWKRSPKMSKYIIQGRCQQDQRLIRSDWPIMQMSYLVNDWKYWENLPAKNWYVRKATFARSRVCRRRERFMLHALYRIMSKTLKILKQAITDFLTDFLEFISLLSETLKMCMNYNVDSNIKSSNYSKIQFKPLIYFKLQQSSN